MDNFPFKFSVIFFAIVLIIFIIAFVIIFSKIAKLFSNGIFGQLFSMLKHAPEGMERMAQTPKSVNGMNSIYLPQIQKDFPAFHYDEFRQKAENTLRSIFIAKTKADPTLLVGASDALQRQLALDIQEQNRQHHQVFYDDVKIHQTAITEYIKQSGTCTIIFQSSLEYKYYVLKDGELISGDKNTKQQTRFNIYLLYVQDKSKLENAQSDKALGLSCPNCGASITTIGHKRCSYCGSSIEEASNYAWQINRYEEK